MSLKRTYTGTNDLDLFTKKRRISDQHDKENVQVISILSGVGISPSLHSAVLTPALPYGPTPIPPLAPPLPSPVPDVMITMSPVDLPTQPLIDTTNTMQHINKFAPEISSVEQVFHDLEAELRPSSHLGLHHTTANRLRDMKLLCYNFVDMQTVHSLSVWIAASLKTAASLGRGPYYAKQLRLWTQAYIKDHKNLPAPHYPQQFGRSLLSNKEFTQMLEAHLQSLGPYLCAKDIVDYVKRPEIMAKLKLKLLKGRQSKRDDLKLTHKERSVCGQHN
ncbi:hypothetical protein BDN72DRAFT_907226 [Pluteus cervinus]|uniref:Uncharacterized protein n=1 Tax=Pluteus cervinus TaxID=181527 RepID=A0ACD2ZXU3_9AGAR|nr:hypothetical protein BDN72DRAFT_907226 [Pluteus cervinus]